MILYVLQMDLANKDINFRKLFKDSKLAIYLFDALLNTTTKGFLERKDSVLLDGKSESRVDLVFVQNINNITGDVYHIEMQVSVILRSFVGGDNMCRTNYVFVFVIRPGGRWVQRVHMHPRAPKINI